MPILDPTAIDRAWFPRGEIVGANQIFFSTLRRLLGPGTAPYRPGSKRQAVAVAASDAQWHAFNVLDLWYTHTLDLSERLAQAAEEWLEGGVHNWNLLIKKLRRAEADVAQRRWNGLGINIDDFRSLSYPRSGVRTAEQFRSVMALSTTEALMPVPPDVLISGFSAVLQAIQTWVAVRDRDRTRETFNAAFEAAQRSPEVREQAARLAIIIPKPIYDVLSDRVMGCWTSYQNVITQDKDYLPDEVDRATEAVKRCVCRELNRILDLNGSIPGGVMNEWWNRYCAEKSTQGG